MSGPPSARTTPSSAARSSTPFEQHWADYCGRRHAIGVANGTDALELILAGSGIGAGDEVIVPANTFLATAEAVCNVGAAPVFVDVDPDTLLIEAPAVEAALSPRTAAVMVVHLYGQMADVDAIGAALRPGRHCADRGCGASPRRRVERTSAGLLSAPRPASASTRARTSARSETVERWSPTTLELADRIRSIANHGRSSTDRDAIPNLGRNSRLDGLQAAVLDVEARPSRTMERRSSGRPCRLPGPPPRHGAPRGHQSPRSRASITSWSSRSTTVTACSATGRGRDRDRHPLQGALSSRTLPSPPSPTVPSRHRDRSRPDPLVADVSPPAAAQVERVAEQLRSITGS